MFVEIIYPMVIIIFIMIFIVLLVAAWFWYKHKLWEVADWLGRANDRAFVWAMDRLLGKSEWVMKDKNACSRLTDNEGNEGELK